VTSGPAPAEPGPSVAGMTSASSLVCDDCGFDAARWSRQDLERTIREADELIGHAEAGSPDGSAPPFARTANAGPIVAVHELMHHLHRLARWRRENEEFEPMTGTVGVLHASRGGVPKRRISDARIGLGGVDGDVQSNRTHHGRPWQALCLYSSDVIAALRSQGHPIAPGSTGENVTISGIDWSRLRGGLEIEIGEVRCRLSAPATPCHKIGASFAGSQFGRIDHDHSPGWSRWYASVVRGGLVSEGDAVTVTA
jgi:MOSC domain-containing protein YiiM